MNVKRIEAVLNSRYAMQELECLQLGNLYVCADKTSEIGHLVYRQEDWCGELRHNGFKVRELEEITNGQFITVMKKFKATPSKEA